MDTKEPTLLDNVRGLIGHIAWFVFLWSIKMTDEQYNYAVHISCIPENGAAYCEHGYNGICKVCDAIMTPPRVISNA